MDARMSKISRPSCPERTGLSFELESYLNARKDSWHKLYQLNDYISKHYVSVLEEDVHLKIKEVFGNDIKFWHPHKVRFAQNTKCSFKDKSTPHIKLQEHGKYFIDLGPILESHEADVGQTWSVGDKTFRNPAQVLFNKLEEIWLKEGTTGEELYNKARELAHQQGLVLNEKMQGHRLGDFPHALVHRGGLGEFEHSPKEMLWVLEVHLIDENLEEGYFFEDILGAPKLEILQLQ